MPRRTLNIIQMLQSGTSTGETYLSPWYVSCSRNELCIADSHMSYSQNSLKQGYKGDSIENYYRGS